MPLAVDAYGRIHIKVGAYLLGDCAVNGSEGEQQEKLKTREEE